VGPVDGNLLQTLQADLQRTLKLRVKTMGNMPVPEESYERGRNQYHSTKILKVMLVDVPTDAMKILGLIDKDLCIPILTYVFGEAQLGGTASIVALARLKQEFHGLPANRDIFYERIRKESLHELGHTFGLTHCRDPECVMCLANTVMDVDRKGRGYCRECEYVIAMTIDSGGG
jgi:archaemetzincin